MIRRFRLEQKSNYEKLVIAQRLADMLEKFLDGRPAPLLIGAEKGGIEEWDDVVIVHPSGSIEHLQIKRQATHFCNKNPDKSKYTADAEPANSVIDSAFISLAKQAESGALAALPDRQFQLTLVGAHLTLKNDLTVNHLDELCGLCRRDGLDLDELADRKDGPTLRAYLWLTTWCGFKDWHQIRETLRRVTIVCVGNEATLKQRSEQSLDRHFSNAERTLERLISYITAETSDVSALGCHAVALALREELRPDVETWAQYQLGAATPSASRTWSFSGTHDLARGAPRSAQGVVEHLWGAEPGNRRLRVYAPYVQSPGANISLPSAILRMALHLPTGSQSLMQGVDTWRGSVGHEVGHTLGCAESDLNSLPWLNNDAPLACAIDSKFETQAAVRAEAEALTSAMDNVVWQRLVDGVDGKLSAINDPALADAMETVWREWLDEFSKAPESRRKFLDQLLYPATEGKNAAHALRLGPRTLDLLITAAETLLLVAVGVSGSGNSWVSFPECGEVLSIALKYWSGPAGSHSEVRELSDDPLMMLIGPAPAPVVILSGVSASPAELLNTGMADDAESTTSMAAERQPHLLVTRSGAYNHLRRGSLTSVRQHFTNLWQERLRVRESAIEKNVKGL